MGSERGIVVPFAKVNDAKGLDGKTEDETSWKAKIRKMNIESIMMQAQDLYRGPNGS